MNEIWLIYFFKSFKIAIFEANEKVIYNHHMNIRAILIAYCLHLEPVYVQYWVETLNIGM